MEFPAYIPEPVRRYCKDSWVVDVMQPADRQCLDRLTHDLRMREVYSLLTKEIKKESDWSGFIDAAWSARMSYSHRRETLKRAQELTQEIADAATKLATLLRRVDSINLYLPAEFHSIRELLRKTDCESDDGMTMWRVMRNRVIGEMEIKESITTTVILPPREDEPEVQLTGTLTPCQSIPDPQSILNYAWEKAPSLSALLDTLAETAQMFDPCESSSMIASAIFSQKNNPKYEYLRALIHLLTEVHGFEMDSPVIRKAILLTATVVIDIEVSDKDVNNAWEQLVRKSKEDSCKNSR